MVLRDGEIESLGNKTVDLAFKLKKYQIIEMDKYVVTNKISSFRLT